MSVIAIASLPLVFAAQGVPATRTCSDGSVILASDSCPSELVSNEWNLIERTKSWEIVRSSKGNGCQLRLLEKSSAAYFTGTQPSAWIQAMRNRPAELWLNSNPRPANQTNFPAMIYAGQGAERSYSFLRKITSFGRTNSFDLVTPLGPTFLDELAGGPTMNVSMLGTRYRYTLPESGRAVASFKSCVAKS